MTSHDPRTRKPSAALRAADCLSELLETIPDAEVAILDVLSEAHERDLNSLLLKLLAATSGLATSPLDQACLVSDGISRALADPRPGLGNLHRSLTQLHEWAHRGVTSDESAALIRLANELPGNLDQAYHDAAELLNDLPKPQRTHPKPVHASVAWDQPQTGLRQLTVGNGSILVSYRGTA